MGLGVVGLMAAVFYFWTSTSNAPVPRPSGPQTDYYNQLVRGLRSGHAYMDAVPDPELVAMPLDQRPGARPYLLDASLYGDHYYLYFGVTPVLTGFLPYALICGRELPCELLVATQATLGCWLGLAMLGLLRGKFFPRAGRISLLVAAGAFAFATAVPMTLRKSEVYEAAVTAGFLWGMAMIFFATLAILRARQRTGWLACASLSAGLAVGSRPNLLAGALALGVALIWCWWRAGQGVDHARRWRWATAAILPAALVGAGLALYNQVRFGDPLEFGHRFQVGSIADNYISLRYFLHNLTVYYLTPPSAGWFFPFFSPGLEGARPMGYIGIEYVDGEWWFLPWIVALTGLSAAFWRRITRTEPLAVIAAILVFWFAANFAIVASISARANRYMLDFHPALVLLAGLALLAWSGRGGAWRWGVVIGSASLLLAALVNVLESLQVHEFFRMNNPASYAAIERVANRVVWPVHRLTAPELGPVEFSVTFPNAAAGTREPLLSTGAPMLSDTISIYFSGVGRARLDYDHEGHGGPSGPEFAFEPGRTYQIKIWLGSLLPPVEHPWFDGVAREAVQWQKQGVMVQLDGRVVFTASAIPHDASPGQVRIGAKDVQYTDSHPRFSGRVEHVRRFTGGPPMPGPQVKEEALVYGLEVMLPRDRFGLVEPLVATGARENGDAILIEYSTPESVRIGHDQIGGGIEWSKPMPVDYAAPLALEISFEPTVAVDPLDPREAATLMPMTRLRGQNVTIGQNSLHPFDPAQVSVGCNAVGASSSRLYFGGTILSWKFVGDRVRREIAGQADAAGTCIEFVPPHDLSPAIAEPLLAYRNAAGARGVLAVRSAGKGLMQLGWIESAAAVWSGKISAGETGRVRLELRRTAERTARALAAGGASAEAFCRGRIEVDWNGMTVFQPRLAFFDAPVVAVAGWSNAVPERADVARRFSGEILEVEPRPNAILNSTPGRPRAVQMMARFPSDRTGVCEPLLTAGRTGAADSIFVRYVDSTHVGLGFDHWGKGGPESAPIEIDFAVPHELELTFGSGPWAQGGEGLLQVRLDGRVVIETRARFHPAQAGEIVVGENPVGLSTSVPEFSGVLNSLVRR